MKQDKKSTGTPLTDESFRRICQERLKDFPSLNDKIGQSCIRSVPKPWQSPRVQLVSHTLTLSLVNEEKNKKE
jgi:hypothetical protein